MSLANGRYEVDITALRPRPMVLHWGVNDWKSAPAEARPPGTVQIDDKAVQTPLENGQHVKLSFPEASRRPSSALLSHTRMPSNKVLWQACCMLNIT